MISARARSLLLALAFLTLSAIVHAQPNAAAKSFDEGLAYFKRQEYSDAAEAFYKAYRLAPHADALYNAGLAWELSGDPSSAATAYEKALAMEQLGPEAQNDVQTRLAKLAKQLGRVEVSVPEGATIRVQPFSFDESKAVFYFDPGKRTVRVTLASGRKIERAVNALGGQTTVVLVEASSSGSSDESEEEETTPETTPSPAKDKKSSTGSDLRTIGWIALGASAVATGAAIVLGLRTLDARDEHNKTRTKETEDVARNRMHMTNYAWAAAIITGAAGAGLLIFAPSDSSASTSALPKGVQFRGRF